MEQLCCRKTRKLELYGIIQVREFVELLHAMKDSQENGTYEGAGGGGVASTEMVVAGAGAGAGDAI